MNNEQLNKIFIIDNDQRMHENIYRVMCSHTFQKIFYQNQKENQGGPEYGKQKNIVQGCEEHM